MIAKRADVLPFWDISRAKLNQYGPNSVVYYQTSPDSAGYAYRANNTYTETNQPPDQNSQNWTVDKSFAVPWKEDGKYEIGSRVYYFNGARAYVYTPTVRYFGGKQPPNEELDEDGIRTWELEMTYSYNQSNYTADTEFLTPVKKFVGFTGSKVGSFDPVDPEERPVSYSINIGGTIEEGKDEIVQYLQEKGIISSDYYEFNSIYQSNPYDSGVYVFQKLNTQDGSYTHLKKGIHRALYMKQQSIDFPSSYDKKYYTYAKSQYVYTQNYSNIYYSRFSGFAIEMWPNVSESDYELVPTSGLYSVFGSFFVYGGVPRHGVAITPEYDYGTPFDTISFNGEIPDDPNGVGGSEGTNPEDLKYDAVFTRSTPAFNYRISKFAVLRNDYIFNGYEAIPYQVNEGGVWVNKYNYVQRPYSGPFYSMSYQTIDSMDESYVEKDGSNKETRSITRSKNEGNPIDFGPYISSGTITTLIWAGYEID